VQVQRDEILQLGTNVANARNGAFDCLARRGCASWIAIFAPKAWTPLVSERRPGRNASSETPISWAEFAPRG
jgi:hypothetical protein